MAKFCFTGNPFVDAGIAGMCAAAGVLCIEELNTGTVSRAVETLLRVMTDDAMFKKRALGTKQTAFATSEMTIIFPNGPLSQSSYPTAERKRAEYRNRVTRKLKAFLELADAQSSVAGGETCFVDGSPIVVRVGNDEFPLVDSKSKRNFHPGLQEGHGIGAVTALALEFFPLSVLRTGVNSGFFWFVHTAAEKIAVACARLTLEEMNALITRADGLGFFGDWGIPSRDKDAAFIALIRYIATGAGETAISEKEVGNAALPVTAYDFSNDNRGAQIFAHELPHSLFDFFYSLRYKAPVADSRCYHEVLQNDKIGWRAAKKMLAREPLAALCALRGSEDKPNRLRGGWEAHAIYATEVLRMNSRFIRDVEAVSERIVGDDKAKALILTLQSEPPGRALLRLNRQSLITFDEYARLVPPDDRRAPYTARDYLLAAVYERQSAQAREAAFIPWNGEDTAPGEPHPLIRLAEQVGTKLTADADMAKSVATKLASNRLSELRGALLRPVRRGELTWKDFVSIFPPDDARVSYLLRDYLLAYLYDFLHDPELPEAELTTDKAADELPN